jgi:hypothetical protein
MGPFRAPGPRRPWIVVALYALVFLGSPIFHHDIECHLKTPGHCDACAANPQVSRIETGVGLALATLPEAGRTVAARTAAPAPPLGSPHSGRAPPA